MKSEREETVVIGAGIHGISSALALASRGRRSLVLEAGTGPFFGASARNEGKIHLGFVYALDETGATTKAMVEGSLSFAPLIEHWCGPLPWEQIRSDGFGYVVMDEGLAGPDQVEAHYRSVIEEAERAAPAFGSNYVGVNLGGAEIVRHEGTFPGMAEGHSGCWFETPERAVDPRALSKFITEAASREPLVEIRSGHRVAHVERLEGGFALEAETASGNRRIESDNVINCAWDGRPALDGMILGDQSHESFRVKHQVMIHGGETAGIIPATLVQGPYGDVVLWPNGDVYISWYPIARTHFGDRPEDGLEIDPVVADRVHEAIVDLFPSLAGFKVLSHAPCYILAKGATDIHDPGSELHVRLGAEYVESDGWFSIRSSKLTTGPLAGERCAAAITGTDPGY
ncbi:MAG: FAD-binding oxidoreductase [Solirubrobacterales bacterium]|nr:FAD-binding oxidoreductase [Solirubrobacterales bacterium]MCB0859676.1 FAD-binding oxidoreductase [Solirubrobacterales bacterium]